MALATTINCLWIALCLKIALTDNTLCQKIALQDTPLSLKIALLTMALLLG